MKKLMLLTVVLGLMVVTAPAQDNAKETPTQQPAAQPKPLIAYNLQFVLRELQDGKVVNTRNYAAVMQENLGPVDLKIGSRIPVKSEKEFTYMDIGTSIRCWDLKAQPPSVGLNCTVEISNFALPEQKLQTGIATAPVLNQIRSETHAVVEEGKQALISSIDDSNSTKRYEIAVTATKAK